jgi:uncharacterized membrane protein YeaQ/YmgE (transglycosylase-associated protein family)
MTLLAWVIFGAIVGWLARLLMPGRQPMGCFLTVLLGIAGSVIGGTLLGFLVSGRGDAPAGWIGSILGAMLVLWLVQRFGRGSRGRARRA